MIFDRLAGVITKHNRILIIAWLIVLIVCVPLFSKVTSSSQMSVGAPSGDSATAQRLIDRQFGNSTSGDVLFVVITSSNATTHDVRSFVGNFTSAALADQSLRNLTSVTSVYGSVHRLLTGAALADRAVAAATQPVNSLFAGYWNGSLSGIGFASNATSAALSQSVHNQTQLAFSLAYLHGFSLALASSFQSAPLVLPEARLEGTAKALVVAQVGASTLFTPRFASLAYPLAASSPPANETAIEDAVIADPVRAGVPPVYMDAVSGLLSPDHRTMLVLLTFSGLSDSGVQEVRSLVSGVSGSSHFAGYAAVTGDVALSEDFSQASLGDLSIILPVTIVILIAATGIFFRSVVTPGVSLASIGIALGIADTAIVYIVATYLVGLDPNISSILLTVIIGVGTDYSVFLLARYREERVRGADKVLAVSRSVTWAGESIATSGLTVIISFVFLGVFSSVSFLKGIGFAVGGGVLVALLGSLILVPSIIMSVPNFVFWPNTGRRFAKYAEGVERAIEKKSGYFSKSAKFSIRHAKVIAVLALVATVPAAYTWASSPVGYDFLAAAPKSLQSVAAFNNITQSFGAGTIYPTYAVVKFSSPLWNGVAYNQTEMAALDSLTNLTLSVTNVKGVSGPVSPGGQRIDYRGLGSDPKSLLLERAINSMISTNGTFALLKIDLSESPQSETSLVTAQQLRTQYESVVRSPASAINAVYLGGVAGSTLDSKNSVNSQFAQIIAYVMIGVAVVLLLVLGSLFLPLFAIVSIVMSIAWTLATTSLVFKQLYNFPLLFITPLSLFVLLLGLGMDYNVFILTRIREEASKGVPLNDAITSAIERTGGIITAAALILAGSLGALMISSNLLLKEFGFAFFYSVLIDAMIMRTYVVPSVMSLMGKWNFYAPGRLQRVRVSDGQSS